MGRQPLPYSATSALPCAVAAENYSCKRTGRKFIEVGCEFLQIIGINEEHGETLGFSKDGCVPPAHVGQYNCWQPRLNINITVIVAKIEQL